MSPRTSWIPTAPSPPSAPGPWRRASGRSPARTGVAGPDPDERGVPVGVVYIGLATPEGTFGRALDLGRRRRDRIQGLSANHAFDVVRRYLQGLPVEQI